MSKIVEVLTAIANDPEGTKVYSYRDKFVELWELDKLASYKTYIIVWDDIPPRQQDVVATSKYLTPIDWAVAFSLVVNDNKNDDDKNVRILILDLNSQSVSNADSVRFFKLFPQTMPWVRLYRPLDAEDFIKHLRDLDAVPSMRSDLAKSDMALIRNVWAAFLTKPSTPGDHHALANLVGPLLLMGNDTGADDHTKALRSLMKALGLIPDKAKEEKDKEPGTEQKEDPLLRDDNPWIRWDDPKWADRLNRLTKDGGKLNLVLIDDQYEQGWGEVLCKAVGATQKAKICEIGSHVTASGKEILVKASVSPDCLLSSLDGKDQRFNFNICSDPAKDAEILFLDLRLFSGKDEQKEADFFERLISLAEKFIEDGTNNLPWKGFTTVEIEKVKNWIKPENRKREDDNYATALTLLPRILALTDISLPIVIFSSTGRRDIAEMLKDYGNIITDFDKPKFTVDMPEDIARQTKKKFEEALEKAVLLLQGREKCRKIIQNASSPKPLETEGKGKHVELYIDENFINARCRLETLPVDFQEKVPSRLKGQLVDYDGFLELQGWMTEEEKKELLEISNNEDYQKAIKFIYNRSQDHAVKVGGLFAVFFGDTLEGARNKADLFDSVCTESGIMYFDPTPFQNSSAKIKDKKEDSVTELATAMKSTHKPEGLFFVRLSFPIPDADPLSIGNPFDPRSADNLYRHTLSTLIELFLSEVLPALFGQGCKNGSVSIFVATKMKPLTGNDLNMATYSTGQVSSEHNKNLLTSMSRDSVHPFVLDTLAYHQIERKICRAIGVTLPYKKGTGTKTPKIYICRTCKEQRTIEELKQKVIKSCSCETTTFKPDYRALQYIADETLNHVYDIVNGNPTGYGASIKMKPWGFDEEIENLATTISASRKLDNKDVVGSIIEIDPNLYGVTQLLSGRIATELKGLEGWDFCRIAVGLSDEKPEAMNLYRFLMPRVPKNSGTAKAHSTSRSNNMSKNNPPKASALEKPNSAVPINKPLQNVQKVTITEAKKQPQNKVSAGDQFVGKIIGITTFGCFISGDKGIRGSVDMSNLPHDFNQKFKVGQKVPVRVERIDRSQKIYLVLDKQ